MICSVFDISKQYFAFLLLISLAQYHPVGSGKNVTESEIKSI